MQIHRSTLEIYRFPRVGISLPADVCTRARARAAQYNAQVALDLEEGNLCVRATTFLPRQRPCGVATHNLIDHAYGASVNALMNSLAGMYQGSNVYPSICRVAGSPNSSRFAGEFLAPIFSFVPLGNQAAAM